MTRVAIVGAGVAGGGAAYILKQAGIGVTVFERSERVGGRAASRTRGDVIYDYGANYLKSADDRVNELVTDTLDTAGLVDVTAPVYTFTESGRIRPGRKTDDHKWTYSSGLIELTRRLFGHAGVAVELGRTVVAAVRDPEGWTIMLDNGAHRGPYEAVVVTPPAPVAAKVLDGQGNPEPVKVAADRLSEIPYRHLHSAVLHYPFDLDRPFYAVVNTDGDHVVSWLSRETCKPGHVPAGESVLIVQASHQWTMGSQDDTADRQLAAHAASLLDDERLSTPDWTNGCRWSPALPDAGLGRAIRESVRTEGLYLAGDGVDGAGRIHAALRSGLEAADRLVADRQRSRS